MKGKIAAFLGVTLTLLAACAGEAPRGGGSAAGAVDSVAVGAPGASGRALPGEAGGAAAETAQAGGAPAGIAAPGQRDTRGIVLFLGTSLTAGYGLSEGHAFPALIQARMDSAGLPFRAVNAGLSGETAAGGLRRLAWSLQEPVEVLVLELGANDGLRGNDVDATRRTLDTILARTRERYPDAGMVVLGMEAPPNMGEQYTGRFRAMYPWLAEAYGARLVPFLLEGVAGDPALNQADGIHPTARGQVVVADNIWAALEPLLRERAAR